ncbi:MAG: SDR family oxidoreductase [Rhodospirillales bacterium]|nr:SDR family oxidoreductase [Rhodospirillales bacterium]
MQISLSGRSAVITGGSKGLGLAMAERFAASGADVMLLARTRVTLEEARDQVLAKAAPGARVAVQDCDIATAAGVQTGFDAAMAAFGKLDIVINNAGISRAMPFGQISDAAWQEDLDLKLFAAIRLIRLAWPQMAERRWGRVINVLNIGAKAPRGNGAPTAVSRAAGMALMKVLANEGAAHNVLVNALLVGQIESDQWVRRHKAQAASGSNTSLEEFLAGMGSKIPMGRLGRAEEFAATACFLCSDLGGYITGAAINVDGGASPVV